MNIDLGIKPFSDFWINCIFNVQMSILNTLEPSYKYAAYLNDYRYSIFETLADNDVVTWFLGINYVEEVVPKYIDKCFTNENLSLQNDPCCLEKIKNYVRQKKYVAVGVDLFYLIPQSFFWGKYHWRHYSLLNGFDDEKKVFYVFDEDLSGYTCCEVPGGKALWSHQICQVDPRCFHS